MNLTVDPPEAPEQPPIDPRFRARRIEVARAAGRRRLRWIVLAAIIVVVFVGGGLLVRAPFLSVDTVNVSGVVYADRDAIDAVVQSVRGQPMLTLDTASIAKKLEAQPWIRRARVDRAWPRGLNIEIAERTPLAVYGAPDGLWRVVDDEGRVLTTLPGRPVEVLLLATEGPALAPGATVPDSLAGAVRVAAALPVSLKARTLEIATTPSGDLVLHLQPKGSVVLGSADAIRDKLIATLTVLAKVDPASLGTIDVRTPANPVLTGGGP